MLNLRTLILGLPRTCPQTGLQNEPKYSEKPSEFGTVNWTPQPIIFTAGTDFLSTIVEIKLACQPEGGNPPVTPSTIVEIKLACQPISDMKKFIGNLQQQKLNWLVSPFICYSQIFSDLQQQKLNWLVSQERCQIPRNQSTIVEIKLACQPVLSTRIEYSHLQQQKLNWLVSPTTTRKRPTSYLQQQKLNWLVSPKVSFCCSQSIYNSRN